ncbi:hypothetical protein REPUB_Repub03eG0059800 [Reevesia pubescens]
MGRKPCCTKVGVNRGAWSAREDKILTNYINTHGLQRCGKSCRLRWLNYLRPDIKRGNISPEEDDLIIRLHKLIGNRWSLIAGRLPGRTDNEIKNYWNTNLSKRVQGQKITPKTKTTQASNKLSKPTPMDEPKVIRTKAVKCTKAVNVIPRLLGNETTEAPKSESTTASEIPSSPAYINDDNSIDFLMDFDINELLVSDAPISDNVLENGDYGNGFNLIDEVEIYSSVDEAARPDNLGACTNFFQTNHQTWDL